MLRFISLLADRRDKQFVGLFNVQLPYEGFRLKISDGIFTFSGCN